MSDSSDSETECISKYCLLNPAYSNYLFFLCVFCLCIILLLFLLFFHPGGFPTEEEMQKNELLKWLWEEFNSKDAQDLDIYIQMRRIRKEMKKEELEKKAMSSMSNS